MNGRKMSDTLPRPGRVNAVCREWVVIEDGALAYQLQQEEVCKHLSSNKNRNATVRQDFECALLVQKEVEAELDAIHPAPSSLPGDTSDCPLPTSSYIDLQEQERIDKGIAERLQEEEALTEEFDRKLAQKAQDEELARLLYARERARARKAKAKKLLAASQQGQPASLVGHGPPASDHPLSSTSTHLPHSQFVPISPLSSLRQPSTSRSSHKLPQGLETSDPQISSREARQSSRLSSDHSAYDI